MKLIIPPGTTSQTLLVFLQDSTALDGAGLTGLVYNSGSLTAYYARAGAAAVQITLATQTAAGAYSSGGFVAVDGTNMPGVYRLDLPDAALAAGVSSVTVVIKGATNLVPKTIEIQLASVPATVADIQATPLAAIQDSVLAYLTVVYGLESQTGHSTTSVTLNTLDSNQNNIYRNCLILIAGQLTRIVKYVGSTRVATLFPPLASAPGDNEVYTILPSSVQTDSVQVGQATAGAASTITLGSTALTTDDIYNGCKIVLTGGTGANQTARISDYVGSTKVATISGTWLTTPDNTTTYLIVADTSSSAGSVSIAASGLDSTAFTSGALTAIAGSVLTTAANKLATDASGNVSLATGGIGANQVSAAAAAKITDIFMRRALGDIRASANGDTVTINSMLGALSRLANKFEFIDDTTMRVYAEDGTTPFIDITVYRDSTGITGMTPAAS